MRKLKQVTSLIEPHALDEVVWCLTQFFHEHPRHRALTGARDLCQPFDGKRFREMIDDIGLDLADRRFVIALR